jgi:transcriptional regulator with XRE-family HTH domain
MSTTLGKKHFSKAEIAAKLVQADDLARHGVFQRQIARTLGVSVMTLYRWRKGRTEPHSTSLVPEEGVQFEQEFGADRRRAALEIENVRLRRLVSDLLLEKVEFEEEAQDIPPLRGTLHKIR